MTSRPYNKETITGEDMRVALEGMVKKKWFWGKAAAKKMTIEDVWPVALLKRSLRPGHPTLAHGRPLWRSVRRTGRVVPTMEAT